MPQFVMAPSNNFSAMMSNAPVFEVSAPIMPVQPVAIKVQ
jgi:hypothetical protein